MPAGERVPEPALAPAAPAERVPEPALAAVQSPAPAPASASVPVDGWNAVLEKMNRTVRAVYLDAQPEVEDGTLVLWFRYGFHHKKAQEQSAQLMPHVREWLGPGVKVDYRLREQPAESRAAKPLSPEDDPFVREVVRRFDGRVTKVRDVSE